MVKMIRYLLIISALFLFSCSPYQRLVLNPSNLSEFLNDSCDLRLIQAIGYESEISAYENENQDNCVYFTQRFMNAPEYDSSRWFLAIEPVLVGKDEIIVGNLYKIFPLNGSGLIYERRIKEYSQKKNFEGGKYMGFTYYVEDDSTKIIKLGTGKY